MTTTAGMRTPAAIFISPRESTGSQARRAMVPSSCLRASDAKVIWPARAAVLSPEELERYARHIVLREVGGPGQAALKHARVLVIGAGGLGSPVLLYLAAAGVGTLGVIDDDKV